MPRNFSTRGDTSPADRELDRIAWNLPRAKAGARSDTEAEEPEPTTTDVPGGEGKERTEVLAKRGRSLRERLKAWLGLDPSLAGLTGSRST